MGILFSCVLALISATFIILSIFGSKEKVVEPLLLSIAFQLHAIFGLLVDKFQSRKDS